MEVWIYQAFISSYASEVFGALKWGFLKKKGWEFNQKYVKHFVFSWPSVVNSF